MEYKKNAPEHHRWSMIRFLPDDSGPDDNFSLGYNIFVGRNIVNSTNNLVKKVVVLKMFCFYGANEQFGLDRYLPIQAFNPCYSEPGDNSHESTVSYLTNCNVDSRRHLTFLQVKMQKPLQHMYRRVKLKAPTVS